MLDAEPGCGGPNMSIYEENDWWALIGPAPRLLTSAIDETSHDKTRRLAGAETLGDVTLRPGGEVLVEYIRTEPRQLTGYLEHETWPIIVEGTTPISRHLEHDIDTAGRVVRAAVLVSLAWGEPWAVRSAPFRSTAIPPAVAPSWPSPPSAFPEEPHALQLINAYGDEMPPQSLPGWLQGGWSKTKIDPTLWRAALTWHEGLIMQSEHPSFSAIAFISAVETLASSEWAKARLEIPKGSKARVKVMLESVTDAGIGPIIDTMYNSRSKTAHEGRLFAYEASRGAFSALTPKTVEIDGTSAWIMEPHEGDLVHGFLTGVLRPLALATRNLLLGALR
jgi:hypothetical protein